MTTDAKTVPDTFSPPLISPVTSAPDLHSHNALRDDDGLFDLEAILEEIAPAIAERYCKA
jgi:hypothetical protein